MDFETIQNDVVDEALQETIQRGSEMEVLVNFHGWAYIQSYIENSVKAFSNRAIKEGFKDLNEFNYERGRIMGMLSITAQIENDLRILKDERSKKPTR